MHTWSFSYAQHAPHRIPLDLAHSRAHHRPWRPVQQQLPLGRRTCQVCGVQATLHQQDASTAQGSTDTQTPSRGTGLHQAKGICIRRACSADVKEVAELCAKAFAYGTLEDLEPGPLKQALAGVEASLEGKMAVQMEKQAGAALMAKQQARQEAYEVRLQRELDELRAELARVKGERRLFARASDASARREEAKRMRSRMYMCLLAEDRSSGDVLGCAIVSLLAAEALLPAPFPTTKPLRLYVSNMSVAKAARRRGIARALLAECERLGRRWGHDSLWLHVEALNTKARKLYQSSGYREYRRDPFWFLTGQRILLMKQLPALPSQRAQHAHAAGADAEVHVTGGSTRGSDGVFIWDADRSSQ